MSESNTKKILLVDDEKAVGKALKLLLEKKNFNVILVESVDDAEKVLENQTIAVCVTDLALPGRNGVELLKSIRGSEKYGDLPVIVLSGFVSVVQEELAAYDPLKIFKKPPPTDELVKTLQMALDKKS